MNAALSRLGTTAEDYARIGISPDQVAPWEDGARTDGGAGTYEWWYFDAHLDDGAKLVVVFYTKSFTEIGKPLAPMIRMNLDLPDHTSYSKVATFGPAEFTAAQERCDVRIGENSFSGDLHSYRIVATIDDLAVEISLTGEVPAWRPGTGHLYFGANNEQEFNWLPAVPQGKVDVTYRVAGKASSASGVGYHDHNWGNAAMNALTNRGYCARGQAGPYTVVASYITAEQKYGSTELPIFLLANGDQVVADDAGKVTFEELGTYTDSATGKPVANVTRYTYTDGDERYVVTYTRHSDLSTVKFVDGLKGPKKLAAMVTGFDGAYLRFVGEVRIEHYQGEEVVENYTDDALWELMYFGKARP